MKKTDRWRQRRHLARCVRARARKAKPKRITTVTIAKAKAQEQEQGDLSWFAADLKNTIRLNRLSKNKKDHNTKKT